MNGKVIDDFDIATSFGVADGIYWAANNGATVINMSLGAGNSCEPNIFEDGLDIGVEELRDAINYAWNRNIVLVRQPATMVIRGSAGQRRARTCSAWPPRTRTTPGSTRRASARGSILPRPGPLFGQRRCPTRQVPD